MCCKSLLRWNDQGIGRFILFAIYLQGPQSHYTNYSLPPPPPPWDGSHILPPYEIFPLPPCGVVGVWNCPPPPPVVWWGCGTVPLPPLWCGGGVVLSPSPCVPLPPRGVVGVWYGMLGMYGVYGRSGMACLESMVCLVCMVGMLCMA